MFVPEPAQSDIVVLWDMNNLAHRCYNAFQSLTTNTGTPSGHIYGTLQVIASFFKQQEIDRQLPVANVWCFDSYPRAKYELFEEVWGFQYKGDRRHSFNPIPDVFQLVTQIAGTVAVTEGLECDCTLANLARIFKDHRKVFVVTNDRDLWTLADEVVLVSQKTRITNEKVWDEFLVAPSHVSLWKAVFGDSSDCIPPILPRIPKKEVLPFIRESDGTAQDFLVKISESQKWGPKFAELAPKFLKQWDIVRLFSDDLPTMKTYQGDKTGLQKFCGEFGIKKVAWDFFLQNEKTRPGLFGD